MPDMPYVKGKAGTLLLGRWLIKRVAADEDGPVQWEVYLNRSRHNRKFHGRYFRLADAKADVENRYRADIAILFSEANDA